MPFENILVLVSVLFLGLLIVIAVWKRVTKKRPVPARGLDRSGPPAPPQPRARRGLVVNPEWDFARIHRSVQMAGYSPDLPPSQQEPVEVVYRNSSGLAGLTYRFDPETGMRALDIEAPADHLRSLVDDLVNEPGWMSTIETTLGDYLKSTDARRLLFGIRAAEYAGRGADHKHYYDRVRRLCGHEDPRVASEARRVHDVLVAEAGGNPQIAGPRGQPLVWSLSGNSDVPYWTQVQASRYTIRVNANPAPDKFTLLINEQEVDSFSDWPACWTLPRA